MHVIIIVVYETLVSLMISRILKQIVCEGIKFVEEKGRRCKIFISNKYFNFMFLKVFFIKSNIILK